jgi:hypothetical protein
VRPLQWDEIWCFVGDKTKNVPPERRNFSRPTYDLLHFKSPEGVRKLTEQPQVKLMQHSKEVLAQIQGLTSELEKASHKIDQLTRVIEALSKDNLKLVALLLRGR